MTADHSTPFCILQQPHPTTSVTSALDDILTIDPLHTRPQFPFLLGVSRFDLVLCPNTQAVQQTRVQAHALQALALHCRTAMPAGRSCVEQPTKHDGAAWRDDDKGVCRYLRNSALGSEGKRGTGGLSSRNGSAVAEYTSCRRGPSR